MQGRLVECCQATWCPGTSSPIPGDCFDGFVLQLPITVVRKQVGRTSLKTTSVYLKASEEAVVEAYRAVTVKKMVQYHNP